MLRSLAIAAAAAVPMIVVTLTIQPRVAAQPGEAKALDRALAGVLKAHGFTGRIEQTLETRLGRKIDPNRADLGRFLFFDRILGLKLDNACAGCHSPLHGFGDSQPMAIGIDNNNVVGRRRSGPRNMRRTPMVINNAFYPKLMWNSRFVALSGDPFDNSEGFEFPAPEGRSLSNHSHLLVAQAFIPPTERNEMAGFEFEGDNDDIRDEVVGRLNATPNYRWLFRNVYADIGPDDPITYDHVAQAIAEFEFTLTFANAPIDQFARGNRAAMTPAQKRGALLFFGKARCVSCHAVAGAANEMFSDFTPHVLAVPQVAAKDTNATFDGPGGDEDFGLEQITGDPADRYKFRTSPLRNVALQPAFFHNGAYVTLSDAIAHHLYVVDAATNYTSEGRLPEDLSLSLAPTRSVLDLLDPRLRRRVRLTRAEFADLTTFVSTGLLDTRATPDNLAGLIPRTLPSRLKTLVFEP